MLRAQLEPSLPFLHPRLRFYSLFPSPGDSGGRNNEVALLAVSSHTLRLESRRPASADVRKLLGGQRTAVPPSRSRMPPTTFSSILYGPSLDLQGSAPITALTRTPSASPSPWQHPAGRASPLPPPGPLNGGSVRCFLGDVVGRARVRVRSARRLLCTLGLWVGLSDYLHSDQGYAWPSPGQQPEQLASERP